jgi:hypothetical protein
MGGPDKPGHDEQEGGRDRQGYHAGSRAFTP